MITWKKKKAIRRIRIVAYVEHLYCVCGQIMDFSASFGGTPEKCLYTCPSCGEEKVDMGRFPRYTYRPSLWNLRSFILWKLNKIVIK